MFKEFKNSYNNTCKKIYRFYHLGHNLINLINIFTFLIKHLAQ